MVNLVNQPAMQFLAKLTILVGLIDSFTCTNVAGSIQGSRYGNHFTRRWNAINLIAVTSSRGHYLKMKISSAV